MKKIGFVGVGTMGKPMAKNLLKAKFPVTVYNRSQEPVKDLVSLGAMAANSPKELARNSDVVILMVPDAPDVEKVLFEKEGVMEGVRESTTIIVMSTIEFSAMKDIVGKVNQVKKGIKVLDAPVTRGLDGAIAGILGIWVGGSKEDFDDCLEVFRTMGSDVLYCGDVGMGMVVKMVNNYITINTAFLLSEALVLGVKCGMKPETLIEMLAIGSGNSYQLQRFGRKVLNGNFSPPSFRLELAFKDIGIGLATAKEFRVPVPIGALCFELAQAERLKGKGCLDYAAVVTSYEELAGVKIRKEIPK
jgi:2-hydroxy-3-oxopropionate reductase